MGSPVADEDSTSLRLRLRGGGDDESEAASQGFDDAEESEAAGGATQPFGDDDDDDEDAVLVWLRDGQAAGVAAALPREGQVLAIGRDVQPELREGGVAVQSLQLNDQRPHGQKVVSGLQAEIVCEQGVMVFISKGQSFNFLNGDPLHARSRKLSSSAQIFDDDVLRLGGDADGKPKGGVQDFVLRVEASALGRRSAGAPSAKPAVTPAPAAAAAPSGGDSVPIPPSGPDAAAAVAAAPKLTPLDAAGGTAITLAPAAGSLLNRTIVEAGFITSNRNGSYDLHAKGEGLAYSRGTDASWVNLKPGTQRQIVAGALVEIGGVRYRCDIPAWRVGAAPAAAPVSKAAGAAGGKGGGGGGGGDRVEPSGGCRGAVCDGGTHGAAARRPRGGAAGAGAGPGARWSAQAADGPGHRRHRHRRGRTATRPQAGCRAGGQGQERG